MSALREVPSMIDKNWRESIYQQAYRHGHNEGLAEVRARAVEVE